MAFENLQETHPRAKPPTLVNLDINGISPFWSPEDNVDQCLSEAHAILMVFAAAFDDSEAVGNAQNLGYATDNVLCELRHSVKARALEGVARLIALAQHSKELADFEDSARRAA